MVAVRWRIDGDGQRNGQGATLGPVPRGTACATSAFLRWVATKRSRCLRAAPGQGFGAMSIAVGLDLAGIVHRRSRIRFLRVCRTTRGLRFLALGVDPEQHEPRRGCGPCTDEQRLVPRTWGRCGPWFATHEDVGSVAVHPRSFAAFGLIRVVDEPSFAAPRVRRRACCPTVANPSM